MSTVMYVNALLLVAGFVVSVFGGDPIVQVVLARFESHISDRMRRTLQRNSVPGAGRYIGYLERAICFVLVVSGQPGAIVFVIAAKAIVRIESAKDRPFAEYFLIGTFTSVFVAVIVATIITPPVSLWR